MSTFQFKITIEFIIKFSELIVGNYSAEIIKCSNILVAM